MQMSFQSGITRTYNKIASGIPDFFEYEALTSSMGLAQFMWNSSLHFDAPKIDKRMHLVAIDLFLKKLYLNEPSEFERNYQGHSTNGNGQSDN